MTGLQITNHDYVISKIVATKDATKHIARIIIDACDQPQFNKQGHSRAELLIEEMDWINETAPGRKIKMTSSAPMIKNKWSNGKYENCSNVYPHAKYTLVEDAA